MPSRTSRGLSLGLLCMLLSCQQAPDLTAELTECLEFNPNCEDGWYDDCTSDLTAEVAVCPQLPADIQPMFTACTQ